MGMQTLGYIYLFDREGNRLEQVQVLYRITRYNSYLKKRKHSKNIGCHFKSEEVHIQSKRFQGIEDYRSDEACEAYYQELISGFLTNGDTISC